VQEELVEEGRDEIEAIEEAGFGYKQSSMGNNQEGLVNIITLLFVREAGALVLVSLRTDYY